VAGNAVTFDISAAEDVHYRGRLRLARMAAFVVIIVVGLALTLRLIESGVVWISLTAVSLIVITSWYALFVTARGPISLRVAEQTVDFIYRSGRKKTVTLTGPILQIRLAEAVPRTTPLRFGRAKSDAQRFAIRRDLWIAITPEAFDAVDRLVRALGYRSEESFRPGQATGGWRIHEYGLKQSS